MMQQSPLRMPGGGQRMAQKRTASTAFHTKPVGGQQQVTMVMPARASSAQQIRTFSRNITYQGSRMSPAGLVMSGSSRIGEALPGSSTTRQLSTAGIISRQNISGASTGSKPIAAISMQGGTSTSAPIVLQDIVPPSQKSDFFSD
ncbi:unnamed protein product [Gongylonema pulchrum]|uniref:Nucleoporin NUP53 n=1 Tax=Gongylonema pulchrum TaxID=637853 RepID=A0A183EU77_9BILA|nr:unnamed protein product [Gongylonema pulchrum]